MTTQINIASLSTAITAPLSYAIVAAANGKNDKNRQVTFTVHNDARNTHITIRIRRPKGFRTMLVDAMTGSDNETGFEYIGSMNRGLVVKRQTKNTLSAKAEMVAAGWEFTLKAISNGSISSLPLSVHHDGKCACCGRKLTQPASLASGIGPVCAKTLLKPTSKVGGIK